MSPRGRMKKCFRLELGKMEGLAHGPVQDQSLLKFTSFSLSKQRRWRYDYLANVEPNSVGRHLNQKDLKNVFWWQNVVEKKSKQDFVWAKNALKPVLLM